MTKSNCAECTFFEEHAANTDAELNEAGLCRFNPPVTQPTADSRGLWPVVKSDDWCGHFETQAA